MIYKMVHRKLKIDLSCSTSATRHVTLIVSPVLNHEWGSGL